MPIVSTGQLTISDLMDGLNARLSNNSHVLPADTAGVVSSFAGCITTMTVFIGSVNDTANWTFTAAASSGLTGTLSVNTYTVTALSVDTGFVDITATKLGQPSLVARFSVAKSKTGSAGSAGVSPISYEVLVNAPVIVRSTSNVLSPSSIIVSAFSTVGAVKTAYSGRFKIYENGSAAASYTSSTDQSTYTYTPTSSSTVNLLKVELYLAGGTTTLLDIQEISVLVAGSSAIDISLSNDAYLIPADNSGAVATYVGSGTNIQVFEGSIPLTFVTTIGTAASRFVIGTPFLSVASSITVGARSGVGSSVATVAPHSAMSNSVDAVVISYPITYNRANGAQATQIVTQSITKAKAGTLGIRGSRQVYSTDVAYTSLYDFDAGGAIAAGGPSYAAKAAALIATVTAGSTPTTPINGDTVTFSNGTDYVYTITYDGTSWVAPGTIIDGSLLVTGSVTASKINSNGLSVRDSLGNIILSAGTPLQDQLAPYESGATVGATSANLKAGVGSNLIFNGGFEDGVGSWELGYNNTGAVSTLGHNLSNPDYTLTNAGLPYVHVPGTHTSGTVFDARILKLIPVKPNTKYEVSALLNTHRCQAFVLLVWFNTALQVISEIGGNGVSFSSQVLSLSDLRQSATFANAPATAAFAQVIIRGQNLSPAQPEPYVFFKNVFFAEAGEAQTTYSPYNSGRGISQITATNSSTYVGDSAISNVQIGGDLLSTNYNSSGGTAGWRLDRAGNIYANSGSFRGSITANTFATTPDSSGTTRFSANASGLVTADRVQILRRDAIFSGTIDPTERIIGTYQSTVDTGESSSTITLAYPAGTVFTGTITQIISVPGLVDANTQSTIANQPYYVAAYFTGAFREFAGASSTYQAHLIGKPSSTRSYSNTGAFANDYQIAIVFEYAIKLVSGSFTSFRLPTASWTIFKI